MAARVTGQQVLDAVLRVQGKLNIKDVDPKYFVATVFHEAGCLNEWDTEIATASCPPGYVSVGAYQIGDEEAQFVGHALQDMLDLDASTECMVKLASVRRRTLRTAAKIPLDAPDPDYTDASGKLWTGGAMRAYLALAHNHGAGYATTTIANYGLNWGSYKVRNPSDNIVAHGYGEDCITGGPFWPEHNVPETRILLLTDPPITGDDVRDLQVRLKISEDGVFGIDTDRAVRGFQRSHGLVGDGEVGPKTLAALRAAT